MSSEIIKFLLRSEGRRRLLREIAREKVITTSELAARTGLTRQAVTRYVKEFEDAGLITIKKGQKPWIIIAGEDLEYYLYGLPTLEEQRKVLRYPCSWSGFPECIIRNELSLTIIWGSQSITFAKAHDAVGIPELVVSLIRYARDRGIRWENIDIRSAIDSVAVSDPSLLNSHLLLLGSGVVNMLTAKIMEIFTPPIRFEPPLGREILSDITGTFYSAGHPVHRNAGLLALLPNPWSKERVAIVAAGIFRQGTTAAVKALIQHLRRIHLIENHPSAGIPIRVVRADERGEFIGFLE